MFRKGIVLVVMLLFIGISVFSSSGYLISNKTTSRGITISFDPSEPNGDNGWYVTSVTVYFYADNGTIIESIYIRIDGGSWQSIPGNHIELTFEGEHTYDFLVIDKEENNYPFGPYEIKIDTFSPEVELIWEICGNIFTGKYILLTATCQDSGGNGFSGISHVEFYMNETVQAVDDTPPYTWILKWPYPPPISFLKVVAYDNAGNSEQDEFSYTMPWDMYIIGFIRNPEINGAYLKFHADFVITFGYYGIMRNKDIIIELYDYEGNIGNRFINAKISAFWIPIPKK